jgi:hypothetical protein
MRQKQVLAQPRVREIWWLKDLQACFQNASKLPHLVAMVTSLRDSSVATSLERNRGSPTTPNYQGTIPHL